MSEHERALNPSEFRQLSLWKQLEGFGPRPVVVTSCPNCKAKRKEDRYYRGPKAGPCFHRWHDA